jgi:hypothetical protein
MLEQGDRVLVAHRRLYATDEARFFVGRVDGYDAGIVKVTGWSYVRDTWAGAIVGKEEIRTKLISVASGTSIIYQLPKHVELESVRFESTEHRLTLTDGGDFVMNLTELPDRSGL